MPLRRISVQRSLVPDSNCQTASCLHAERTAVGKLSCQWDSQLGSMSVPKCISAIASGQSIRLVIRAKPGAKKSNVVSIDDEAIGVQIAAPAR